MSKPPRPSQTTASRAWSPLGEGRLVEGLDGVAAPNPREPQTGHASYAPDAFDHFHVDMIKSSELNYRRIRDAQMGLGGGQKHRSPWPLAATPPKPASPSRRRPDLRARGLYRMGTEPARLHPRAPRLSAHRRGSLKAIRLSANAESPSSRKAHQRTLT
jgi:hypothetical protein